MLKRTKNTERYLCWQYSAEQGKGELLGLKWSDIEWYNSQIHIQRTFNKGMVQTKTKASNRKIDLGPSMMTELKKWKLACPPNELDLGISK